MKPTIKVLALAAALAAIGSRSTAAELVDNEKLQLDADGRMQWLAVGEKVDDAFRQDGRLYLFMKQARMRFNGKFEDVGFDVQWGYGGEDVVTTNNTLSLLDFSFDVPVKGSTHLKIGQFRVPYSRERLTDAGTLNFGDRSIQNLGFVWNRDVGAALHTVHGHFMGTAGVFTGGGRDVPQRYLPEKLGSPMFVVRFGLNDGVDKDIYNVASRDLKVEKTEKAAFVNALYIKDTLIGHSTVLNVRSTDKSLLINSNWNPFVAQTPFDHSTVWQVGGDAVLRKPMGNAAVICEAEANYGHFSNTYGDLVLKGGRVQAGLSTEVLEANIRYAVLFPDQRMANTYTASGATAPSHSSLVGDGQALHEITPSLTYHYRKNVTVVADLPILINMIVFQENTIGAYLASEQPDQATVVKPGKTAGTGTVERQNVLEGRLMFQVTF
jgi:hypothetical protein